MKSARLKEALRTLPLCLYVVCDRRHHDDTLDGVHDIYAQNKRPCPVRMAPFHLEGYVPAEQIHRLKRTANDLAVLKQSLEWNVFDMIVFYSESTYTTLYAAQRRCSVPQQHVVLMPHQAVQRACTNALTGQVEFVDATLNHCMAWAQRFCHDARQFVSGGKSRISLAQESVLAHRRRLAAEDELAASVQQLKLEALIIAMFAPPGSTVDKRIR